MSYTPTEWATGDIITAEKLNNMESGIAGAMSGGITYATLNSPALNVFECDKTFGEMHGVLSNGGFIILKFNNSLCIPTDFNNNTIYFVVHRLISAQSGPMLNIDYYIVMENNTWMYFKAAEITPPQAQ